MELQEQLQIRKNKGQEIAMNSKVRLNGYRWIVPSQNSNRHYEVILRIDKSLCNCPDYLERGIKCKHIFAVEYTILKKKNKDGSTTITEVKRISYPQNWVAYDKAKTQEKELFMKLLYDLVQTIPEEPKIIGKGRPRMAMADMVFASALKVFTTFSLRRFTTDMKKANELGYILNVPHYSCVALYMESEKLTPILQDLITQSALPLRSVETKFAIDSTGFRTTKFSDYCREKHGTNQHHEWIKAHICSGTSTHIITGIEVQEGHSADSLQFIPLSQRTFESGFKIEEMSADKAYNSKNNYNAIDELGGVAYIPFKSNASPWSNSDSKGSKSKLWRHMLNYFIYKREEFLEHYHLRSNIESTNNMIKSKFTDMVRSRNKTAQVNEVLLKVLCHNICVLIQEMFELGIEPNFLE